MKERGIIFSGPMVQAILDGRKSQTRRVIKPQPRNYLFWSDGFQKWYDNKATTTYDMIGRKCPYGVPGDRFYMRENLLLQRESGTKYFDVLYDADSTHFDNGHELDDWFMNYGCWYDSGISKRIIPCIHMPRYAARPERFEITDIRVQKIQDISEEDAIAEGSLFANDPSGKADWTRGFAKACFEKLWDSINAKPKPITKNSRLARLLLGSETLNRIVGNIACYVSYPWEDIQETREYRGKKWFVRGNPFCWCISYRKL